jgi:hypothetical protein
MTETHNILSEEGSLLPTAYKHTHKQINKHTATQLHRSKYIISISRSITRVFGKPRDQSRGALLFPWVCGHGSSALPSKDDPALQKKNGDGYIWTNRFLISPAVVGDEDF